METLPQVNLFQKPDRINQKISSESKDSSFEGPVLNQEERELLSMFAIFADNWGHKEIDQVTKATWARGLAGVHRDLRDTAITRCVQELQYWPTVSQFLERTIDPSRLKKLHEKMKLLPEPERNPIPMPSDFKQALDKWLKKTST